MTKRQWIITLTVLLLIYGLFVWQYERYKYQRTHRLTDQYSIFLEPYLWNFDKKNTTEILRFITELQSFKSAKVKHPDGRLFAQSQGEGIRSDYEAILKELNLINTFKLTHDLTYQGQTIGSLEVAWIDRSIYMHGYGSLVLILVGFIVYFYITTRAREQELQQLRLEKE
ncbi:MAG: hypothetical protein ABEK50_17660, partial [bacterium]